MITPLSLFAADLSEPIRMSSNTISMNLNQEKNLDDWQVTNDSVMGGLSLGYTQLTKETFIFSGNISTDNNGGFTSVFKRVPTLSENIKSITLRIMGDGNLYQLRVKSQVMGYDVAYKSELVTQPNTIATHKVYLVDFTASFRGRIIDNAPILKATTISHLGFLMAAKKKQNFSLSIYAIEFDE